jgi:hypothetical protein
MAVNIRERTRVTMTAGVLLLMCPLSCFSEYQSISKTKHVFAENALRNSELVRKNNTLRLDYHKILNTYRTNPIVYTKILTLPK